MKILILSFYFRPDLSAGSFRTAALVDALCQCVPTGSQVDVVTTSPNRYHSFAASAPVVEQQPGLSIFRIALPKHRSGMWDQSKAFAVFSYRAIRYVAGRHYDVVFASSSRLMTAVLGAWIARSKGAKLYLDIRDIFVDTVNDVLPREISWFTKPIFLALEEWAIKRADKVNLISPGFSEYFNRRYPKQRFSFFTNGIDDEFLAVAPTQSSPVAKAVKGGTRTVLYAGNVGEGQGLHAIIPELAKAMAPGVRFKVIGDGGRKRALELALSRSGVTNVEVLPPVNRDDLIEQYRAADVLFLHLNDREAFKKVLPSKVFEFAALGKPVWAGVSGYSAEFVRSEITNSAVFHPCDVQSAVRSFGELTLQDVARTDFVKKYARINISKRMAEDILSVVSGK